jgi:hypothetical protein
MNEGNPESHLEESNHIAIALNRSKEYPEAVDEKFFRTSAGESVPLWLRRR